MWYRNIVFNLFAFVVVSGLQTDLNSLTFIEPGDPLLQRRSREVPFEEITSPQTQAIIEEMYAIAKGERDDIEKGVMVGLAAPQIGIEKRIILIDIGVDKDRKELGDLVAYINPEILWYSSEQVVGREGCYSVDSHVVGLVPRANLIKIKAFDRQGNLVETELSGYTACIFQHEVDHLDGIRFPDRVDSEGNLHWVEENEFEEYKKQSDTWPNKCSLDVWMSMKDGAY